jgi:hypothetical protein
MRLVRLVLPLLALAAACGSSEVRTRSVSNNDMCVVAGPGGMAGDSCESPEDCALIACCTCPDGVRMYSAAACDGACLAPDDACAAVLDGHGPRCD